MNVVETEPGVYSVLVEGASYEVRVLGDEVTVNGHRFAVAVEDPRRWKRSGGAAGAQGRISLTAPMPGKVVRLLAAVGDAVTAGQPVVVVEAMKMQNELKSPRDGRVTGVRVRENDSVNAGAVLLVIE
jgi:biotin carboxyl carrier protein